MTAASTRRIQIFEIRFLMQDRKIDRIRQNTKHRYMEKERMVP